MYIAYSMPLANQIPAFISSPSSYLEPFRVLWNLSQELLAGRFRHFTNPKEDHIFKTVTESSWKHDNETRISTLYLCFQVELEVPQLCHFILKTVHCSLRETFGVDSEGRAMLKKSKNSEDFASAMSK